MSFANHFILFASLLFLVSILASTLFPRLGVPLLLIFLVIGMLAGENGPGGIHYDDVNSAYLIGILALAVILFDGGLSTDLRNFRVALRPALSLATFGVIISAAVCGVLAALILDLSWAEGLLIGAIVGSTDAAAVFNLLNKQGLTLKTRVGATLEIESGVNDPMAIFLTIAVVEYLVNKGNSNHWHWPFFLIWQLGGGGLIGVAGGRLLAHGLVRLQLNPGLYPLLALFGGLLIFGVTAELNASGFIAIYLAGLTVGNRVSRGLYSVQRFHDGMAWMAQISLFLILGLLVTPAELLVYAPGALLVGLVLMFIARPVAVWLSLLPFRFTWREQVFISWVGLRGAVPIVLAMFPWMAGLEQWSIFFNIAFFIVLMSLLLQGITIVPLAKFFLLNIPSGSGSSRVQRSELGIPGQSEYEIVGYKLAPDSPALDCTISTLALPGGSKLFSVLRDNKLQDIESDLSLRSGDHVYLLARPDQLLKLDTLLVGDREQKRLDEQQFFGEFILNPLAKLTELGPLYGFAVPEQHARWSISHYIHSRYPHPVVGDRVRLGNVEFVVREMRDARMTKVGLKLPH